MPQHRNRKYLAQYIDAQIEKTVNAINHGVPFNPFDTDTPKPRTYHEGSLDALVKLKRQFQL